MGNRPKDEILLHEKKRRAAITSLSRQLYTFLCHTILRTGAHPDFAHGLHTDPLIVRTVCAQMLEISLRIAQICAQIAHDCLNVAFR